MSVLCNTCKVKPAEINDGDDGSGPQVCCGCYNKDYIDPSEEKQQDLNFKSIVQIKFDNPNSANYFLEWLCGIGEQDYWEFMESIEQKNHNEKKLTATEFDYHAANNGEFGPIVNTTCGRLDDEE